MILDIIKQFNWVDIFIIIIFARICYVSLESGLVIEAFKFFGVIAAIYVTMHYYTILSDFVKPRLSVDQKMPLEFLDFISFVVMAIIVYASFVLLRSVFSRFIKMEAVPVLNKWGGFVFGVSRSLFVASLLSFILVISTISYLKDSARQSYLGRRLFNIAPNTYIWTWDSFVSKFTVVDSLNQTILKVKEDFAKK